MEEIIKLNIGHYNPASPDDKYIFSYSFIDSYEDQKILFEGKVNYHPIKLSKEELHLRHYTILHLYQVCFDRLVSYLNRAHKQNYSSDYWHYKISAWLVVQVAALVDRWMKFEIFASRTKEVIEVEIDINNKFSSLTFLNFNYNFTHTAFNYYLSSMIINALDLPNWKIKNINHSQSNVKDFGTYKNKIPKMDWFELDSFSKIEKRILRRIVCNKKVRKQKWSVPLFSSTLLSDKILKKFTIESYLISIFPQEFHIGDQAPILNEDSFKHPLFLGTFGGFSWSRNCEISNWSNKNQSEIFIEQHGSLYGDTLFSGKNFVNEYFRNPFFSWGWRAHEHHKGKNIVPLPSPMMFRAYWRRIFSLKKENIIFISSVLAVNDSNSVSATHCDFVHEYFKVVDSLICTAKISSYKNEFYYRPRVSHQISTFQITKYIIDHYTDLKILNRAVLEPALFRAKLVIIDSPTSALHKAMAANIPTIILWPNGCNFFREDLDDVLETFERENVLFYDAKEASKHIENIYDDIGSWWFRPSIQKARKKFVNKVCPVDHFYFFKWVWTLSNL